MHQGHLDLIMKAKKENDICYVIVCGYDNEPRANETGLTLNRRFTLVKQMFKDDEQIRVLQVNDTKSIARVNARSNATIGDTIKVAFDLNKIHLFDKDTELTIIN